MKKRIIGALVMSALVLSMAGCGGNREVSTPDSTVSVQEPATSSNSESTPDTGTVAESEQTSVVESQAEEPVKDITITEKSELFNGYMTFVKDNTGYVYDIENKKMYEYDPNLNKHMSKDVKVYGKLAYFDGSVLYNLETKEIIADKDEGTEPWHVGKKACVIVRTEKSISGNTLSIGMIGTDGEWIVPISSDNELTSHSINEGAYISSTDDEIYMASSDNNDWVRYFFSTKRFFDKDDGLKVEEDSGKNYWGMMACDKVLLFDYVLKNTYCCSNPVIYNCVTGETTSLNDSNDYINGILWTESNNNPYYLSCDKAHCLILDNELNVLDFKFNPLDFGGIRKGVDLIDANNDRLVFASNGFIASIKKDGTNLFEPVEGFYKEIVGDYIVLANNSDNYILVNSITGEQNEIAKSNVAEFDTRLQVMLVKNDGAYYLADPADPETLINPFA